MNEEEQKAIRSAKCEVETEKEVGCIFAKWLYIKELEIILNIIDKLEKENEELKDEIDTYEETINDYESEARRDKEEIDKLKKNEYKTYINDKGEVKFVFDNFISKDEIIEKIKELEKAPLVYDLTTDTLKELLKE